MGGGGRAVKFFVNWAVCTPDCIQGRVGGGVIVQYIDFSFVNSLMLFLLSVCHVICEGNGYA